MALQFVAVTRGEWIRIEICPNSKRQACGCPRTLDGDGKPTGPLVEPHPVQTWPANPPPFWPSVAEPFDAETATPEEWEAARDAWARQCAVEALVLTHAKYALTEPEDITELVRG